MNIKKILTQLLIILSSCVLGMATHFLFMKNILTGPFSYLFKNPDIVLWLALGVEIVIFYIIISSLLGTRIPRPIYLLSVAIYSGFLGMLLFNRSGIYDNRIDLKIDNIVPHSPYEVFTFIINIFMFVPIGYFFRRKSFVFFVIAAILIALGIESIQLVFKIGVFDINDMILNLSGMLLGYIVGRRRK
ncbi:hypothetical protein AZF37_01895 [endosymbiont 'TC1' of Trimyema compressum]|uniref:VanZ family protein n=1 Tax=endosymbiont 'TC1' of Trimyema compressum TaxID=243899 RepID=UPI0007F08655|nr:VanZ family protein [endosymbiont 'TC1' of Trimyema compressum]AMP20095.1 hypothetical protein AZF37_01895 [endosymbiont 'TC1' of Trimyema compressum]